MNQRRLKQNIFRNPQTTLLANFAILILIGFALLALPFSHADESVPLLDSFFTSASAVCVTGLITVDTATAWSTFGQMIILLLIQLGGLGVMTFGAMIFRVTGTRLSYSSSLTLQNTFFQKNFATEFRSIFKEIVLITFIIEAVGSIMMFFLLPAHGSLFEKVFSSVFHTISAFCNAGFSIYSESLVLLRHNVPLISLFMFLIIAGGLGYFTLIEILHRSFKKKFKPDKVRWSLNSRIVLIVSGILLAGGMALFLLVGLTHGESGIGEKALNSLFQSVTARTAGFNTIAIGSLAHAPLIILMILMFIGGSPGSTAGGVKTTTIAVMFAHLKSGLKNQSDVNIFERRLPYSVIRRAIVIIFLALMWNGIGILVLSITEADSGIPFIGLLFEQVSAFATVGLSTGATPNLSDLGKIWVIMSMYIGRLGPLTIALWFLGEKRLPVRYPEERIMIG